MNFLLHLWIIWIDNYKYIFKLIIKPAIAAISDRLKTMMNSEKITYWLLGETAGTSVAVG